MLIQVGLIGLGMVWGVADRVPADGDSRAVALLEKLLEARQSLAAGTAEFAVRETLSYHPSVNERAVQIAFSGGDRTATAWNLEKKYNLLRPVTPENPYKEYDFAAGPTEANWGEPLRVGISEGSVKELQQDCKSLIIWRPQYVNSHVCFDPRAFGLSLHFAEQRSLEDYAGRNYHASARRHGTEEDGGVPTEHVSLRAVHGKDVRTHLWIEDAPGYRVRRMRYESIHEECKGQKFTEYRFAYADGKNDILPSAVTYREHVSTPVGGVRTTTVTLVSLDPPPPVLKPGSLASMRLPVNTAVAEQLDHNKPTLKIGYWDGKAIRPNPVPVP